MHKTSNNNKSKTETMLLMVYFQVLCLSYGLISVLISGIQFNGCSVTKVIALLLFIALYSKISFSSKFQSLPKYVLSSFIGMFVVAITIIFINFRC